MRKDYNLEPRRYIIGGIVVAIVVIYIIRLFCLQVTDSRYKEYADSNAFLRKAIYPSRGIIYDREGSSVGYNQTAYEVMLIPSDVKAFDTIDFCNTINITPEQLRKRFTDMKDRRLNPGYYSYSPQ